MYDIMYTLSVLNPAVVDFVATAVAVSITATNHDIICDKDVIMYVIVVWLIAQNHNLAWPQPAVQGLSGCIWSPTTLSPP